MQIISLKPFLHKSKNIIIKIRTYKSYFETKYNKKKNIKKNNK